MWYGIQINETINLLNNILTHSNNPALKFRVKFQLSLLYFKNKQIAEINKLWSEKSPAPMLMKFFKETQKLSYNEYWKYSFFLNQVYYRNIDKGIQDNQEFIKYAMESKAKQFEIGFRLFNADLYFHEGDEENYKQQLKIIGMPQEENWMVIGPFDNKNGFQKKFPPEKKINYNKNYGDKYQPIKWQHAVDGMNDGFINFKDIFQKSDWSVAYALIYLVSPEAKDVQFRIGNNETIKVWLNDREVWKMNQVRLAVLDNDIINVAVKKGLNKILIKVCNRWGDWGFYFRVTDEEGNGLPEIYFASPDNKAT